MNIAQDMPDLHRLEVIVRQHQTIGTAALSLESGIASKRIFELFTYYLSSVSRNAHPVGPSFDEWMYADPYPA
jgi:hypothetical protein